jgi:hypothetical protein
MFPRSAIRASVIALLLVGGCGGSGQPPPPQPEAKSPAEPDAPAEIPSPEVTETRDDSKEMSPTDCTAAAAQHGLLDRTSPHYKTIAVKLGTQVIEETATLRDIDVTVIARIGGCAHYGASFTFRYEAEHSETDTRHHVERALDLLDAIVLREGAPSFAADISKKLRQEIAAGTVLGICHFSVGEIDSVMCGVTREADGKISVALGYDIAL